MYVCMYVCGTVRKPIDNVQLLRSPKFDIKYIKTAVTPILHRLNHIPVDTSLSPYITCNSVYTETLLFLRVTSCCMSMTSINKSISVSTKLSNKHSCVETDMDLFVQIFVSSVVEIFKSVFTTVTRNDINILKFKPNVCVCMCVCVCLYTHTHTHIHTHTYTHLQFHCLLCTSTLFSAICHILFKSGLISSNVLVV